MIALLLPAALAAAPPPGGLLYFILVDRFADAQPDLPGTTDRADLQAWHGGDLPGVEAHLDHLSAMGVSTLWLSPVFRSRQEKFHGHGAFHGYWVEDMDGIEPRLGDKDALSSLAAAAASQDISLVLDMVYNHVSFDSPLLASHPDWFHPPETIEDWDDPHQLVKRQVHGLPDLAQEKEAVYHYLLGRSLYWAGQANAAGFRIDAVRHIPPDFLHTLSTDVKRARGEDFWLLGEDFQGDAVALSESFRSGGFDAMFDFPLRYAMIDVFCRDQHPGRLGAVLSLDRLYDNPSGLVTFLDNHDLPRIASECGGERARVEAALLFMFAVRGTPSITYGTEWLLEGPAEPENRADAPWSEPPVLASTIGQLQALRAAHPALSRASERRIEAIDDSVLRFVRTTAEESATVIVNRGAAPLPAPADATGWAIAGPGGLSTGAAQAPSVPAGGVGVFFGPGQLPGVAEQVTVPIVGGGSGWLVGSGPEVGNWSPEAGVVLGSGASVVLPAGTVLEWKRVSVDEEGGIIWPEGSNRYDLISAGAMVTVR
ncbi:MAG: glycosidase [Myxococcota bacterium]|jgi:glycosidase